MNLRPPGYEPGELPDCSTPRRGVYGSTEMAVWIALAAFLLALAAGIAIAVYRAICTWRLLKRTGGSFTTELDRIAVVTAEIDGQLARAAASTDRLSEAQVRLRASRARLDVQLAAVREARGQLSRVFWFVPGR